MKKERIVLAVLFAAVLVLVLFAGCKKKESSSDFVLNIGYGGGLCEAALHLAYEKGYFSAEGLNVELIKIPGGTSVYEMVTAGHVDASFALLASIIQPLANGLPAKITTGIHTGCDVVLVRADSPITKHTDLKGKKVGIPGMTSSPAVYAKRVLADNGVDTRTETSEVEFVIYNASDLPLVLQNGSVDAVAMNDSAATIAVKEFGFRIFLDSAVDEPYDDQYCCVAFVSNKLAEKHKDIAEKYTRAMQRAAGYVVKNPEEAVHIQVEKNYIAGDVDINIEVIKKFKYLPSVSGAYDMFGVTGKQLQQIGMLSKDVNVDVLQKNSFQFFDGLDPEYK